MIRQDRAVLDAGAGGQRQGERPNDGVAGTRHVVHLPSLGRQMPRGALALVQAHAFFTPRDQHRLAAEPLANHGAGLIDGLVVVAVHAGRLRRLQVIRGDDGHALVESEMLDLGIHHHRKLAQACQPDDFRHQSRAHDALRVIGHHDAGELPQPRLDVPQNAALQRSLELMAAFDVVPDDLLVVRDDAALSRRGPVGIDDDAPTP